MLITILASSSMLSRPFFQPTTIWTLSAQDGHSHDNMSQDKVGSLLFRTIAAQVFKSGRLATLQREDVNEIKVLTKGTAVASILENVQGLFGDQLEISIIGNSALNSQLVDLANKITKKQEDEKKFKYIAGKFYD
ncbi:hypothetical protein DM01DRAFT_1382609 [Hesseltinella vesiculosa]|uniref:Uncharacterized protein n=1 Tax=Hesseltinella vesiculosa TaxID=101127 RepID=A0A1X2GL91_9FUNG|nr:hypothetical protein DM01DRAFT_1382609 [Hesseltinella vesiculosa]